ncbi:WYL domain-containing protein, partial [Pseudoalteromonas fenneropenaei]
MNSQRHLTILELIPYQPSSISTSELKSKLSNRGMAVSTRMLQRDLQAMFDSSSFGLEKDTRTKPYGWSINAQWRGASTRMSMEVAEHYLLLEQLLPHSLPSDIKQSVHVKAEQALNRLNGQKPSWLDEDHHKHLKINLDSKVISQIEHAIKFKRAASADICRVLYKEARWLALSEVSFFALVEQTGVLMAQFMVGTLHDKCYQLPIYRIRNVLILQKPSRTPSQTQLLTLRSAINKGKSQHSIDLIVRVPEQSVVNLGFVQFGDIVTKQPQDDQSVLITYKTQDTEQLTDALLKSSNWLEVVEPLSIRNRIIA